MDRLSISIAGWPVVLEISECEACVRERLAEHYVAFAVPVQRGAPTIRLSVEPGTKFIPLISGTNWEIRSAMRQGRIEFTSYYESGWMDCGSDQGLLVMRPGGDPENYLRVLYAWRCIQAGSLLLHASGVIRNGRGYVFFGPSGSGKTTIARLAQDETVLSDDLVIIKKENERFCVFGVPFRGDMVEGPRTNAAADLVGVYALAKDGENRISEMPRAEAVARLAACAPFVMEQPGNAAKVMGICAELVAAVPVRRLHFTRDGGFWEAIDGLG